MSDAEPSKKAKRSYQKHGLSTLKRAVKELGARALDGRTTLAKELDAERQDLIHALGGANDVSPQELALINMIAQKRIRRKPATIWALLNREKLFDRRKRALCPLALQLETLEEAEARLLEKLGLKLSGDYAGLVRLVCGPKINSDPGHRHQLNMLANCHRL